MSRWARGIPQVVVAVVAGGGRVPLVWKEEGRGPVEWTRGELMRRLEGVKKVWMCGNE